MAHLVVDTPWLQDHLTDSRVAVVDVRPPPFYIQGHIPGAVNLPIFRVTGAGGEPPPPQSLADQLGRLGISRSSHVVAYDEGASPAAATLLRVLRYYRHPAVSVLDGGMTKWLHEGRDADYRAAEPGYASYKVAVPDSDSLVRTDDVVALLGAPDTVIVDVRSPREYLGVETTAARDGHVPGALNIEWSNNLGEIQEGIYVLRSDQELRELYETASVTPDKRAVVYCHSGSRTSFTYMVLKHLGYERVVALVPGWQEWGNRPDTPVQTE